MEKSLKIEEYRTFQLPYVVIDFKALHGKGEIHVDRLIFLESIWDSFNIILWRERKLLGYASLDNEIKKFYDMDYLQIIECSMEKMARYIKFHRSLFLTDVDYSKSKDFITYLKKYSVPCFSRWALINNYDHWVKGRGE